MKNVQEETAASVVADRQGESAAPSTTRALTHTVLIVDDDPDILETLAWTLEDAGYTVAAVTSGREALQWIQAAEAVGEPPALILLDLAMPGMSGPQVAGELHQRRGGTGAPIMVISAVPSAQRLAREMGAACALTKPFDVDRLVTLVKQLAV